jgi:hypothetical protein
MGRWWGIEGGACGRRYVLRSPRSRRKRLSNCKRPGLRTSLMSLTSRAPSRRRSSKGAMSDNELRRHEILIEGYGFA